MRIPILIYELVPANTTMQVACADDARFEQLRNVGGELYRVWSQQI